MPGMIRRELLVPGNGLPVPGLAGSLDSKDLPRQLILRLFREFAGITSCYTITPDTAKPLRVISGALPAQRIPVILPL